MTIIEQIHHDINTSYLKTFQNLEEIVSEDKPDEAKVELFKLGFTKFQEDVQRNEKQIHADKLLTQIKRYKIDYPYHKFITHEELAKIIDKYNLVLSTPERFIGEIPKKNISDILRFKLKEEDIATYFFDDENMNGRGFTYRDIGIENVSQIISRELNKQYNDDKVDSFMVFGFTFDKRLSMHNKYLVVKEGIYEISIHMSRFSEASFSRRINVSCRLVKNINKSDKLFISSLPKIDMLSKARDEFDSYPESNYKSNEEINLILATPDQFKLNKGESFINGSITEVDLEATTEVIKDDPIVLCPVDNGFIIKTMWGPEAQLPEVKDNTLN